MDKVGNEVVRRRVGVRETVSVKLDREDLQWFGGEERVSEEQGTKSSYASEMDASKIQACDVVERTLYFLIDGLLKSLTSIEEGYRFVVNVVKFGLPHSF